jgi:hypothetical protein
VPAVSRRRWHCMRQAATAQTIAGGGPNDAAAICGSLGLFARTTGLRERGHAERAGAPSVPRESHIVGGSSVLKVHEEIAFREVDGHLVVVHLQTGFYYSLNETATLIFRAIRQNKDIPDILKELCEKYDLPEDTARRDLDECIESLVDEQVLVDPRGQGNAHGHH